MKRIILSIFLLSACLLLACTKGGDLEGLSQNTYKVTSALDGASLSPAPANDTTKGSFSGWYDEQSNSLAFTVRYNKDTRFVKTDTLVGLNFYKDRSAIGTAATARTFPFSIIVDATKNPAANVTGSLSFGLSGSNAFIANEKADFINGKWYVVLISKRFPLGIAGGQLLPVKN
ncbi:hypothetical protein [Desertivirga arenae]|uniref:hypothetical protein n=1 Tax=Desertivirga arenae TaxID=2810309 RepID=UPI001A956A1B|nr:hypothetical protein [Pedobacter sp. SYSU D00823]